MPSVASHRIIYPAAGQNAYFCPMCVEEKYMRRCFELALKGQGTVSPNPMVGAVLVHENRIIGEGWHQYPGKEHAEVNCINNVRKEDQSLISKSTLYVSLEPCAHFGKTPPCSLLILQKKIPKVVIACRDSYEEVNGKGIQQLMNNGVEVITGVLEKEALELNKRFFTFHQKRRPYIILKWAQTAGGVIGNHSTERLHISNEYTNRMVHKWRSEEDAILIGTHTALLDDPLLTVRYWPGRNPVRMVLDRNLVLPEGLRIFSGDSKTVVFNTRNESEKENLVFCKIPFENIVIEILAKMYSWHLQSLLVEGGQQLLQSFIDSGYWDEVRVICATDNDIAEGVGSPVLSNARIQSTEKYGNDRIDYYFPIK